MKKGSFYIYAISQGKPAARSVVGYIYDSGQAVYGIDNRGTTARPVWIVTEITTGIKLPGEYQTRKAAAESITPALESLVIESLKAGKCQKQRETIAAAYNETRPDQAEKPTPEEQPKQARNRIPRAAVRIVARWKIDSTAAKAGDIVTIDRDQERGEWIGTGADGKSYLYFVSMLRNAEVMEFLQTYTAEDLQNAPTSPTTAPEEVQPEEVQQEAQKPTTGTRTAETGPAYYVSFYRLLGAMRAEIRTDPATPFIDIPAADLEAQKREIRETTPAAIFTDETGTAFVFRTFTGWTVFDGITSEATITAATEEAAADIAKRRAAGRPYTCNKAATSPTTPPDGESLPTDQENQQTPATRQGKPTEAPTADACKESPTTPTESPTADAGSPTEATTAPDGKNITGSPTEATTAPQDAPTPDGKHITPAAGSTAPQPETQPPRPAGKTITATAQDGKTITGGQTEQPGRRTDGKHITSGRTDGKTITGRRTDGTTAGGQTYGTTARSPAEAPQTDGKTTGGQQTTHAGKSPPRGREKPHRKPRTKAADARTAPGKPTWDASRRQAQPAAIL